MKLVEAQEGRRVLDRLVGYEMSVVPAAAPVAATSAGRVQSVAARLVVERERARMAFRPAAYWDLEGTFAAHDTEFPATLVELDGKRLADRPRLRRRPPGSSRPSADVALLDETGAAALTERLRDAPFRVASVESKPFDRAAQAAVHDVDAAAGGGPQARGSARRARCRSRRRSTRTATSPTCAPTRPTCRTRRSPPRATQILERYGEEYLPPRPAHVPQQGEERAGGARGDPSRGRRSSAPPTTSRGELRTPTSSASTS